MRVEIVESHDICILKDNVNNILKNVKRDNLVDIKYSTTKHGNFSVIYSAMIILK